jgi:hypothetical protein
MSFELCSMRNMDGKELGGGGGGEKLEGSWCKLS